MRHIVSPCETGIAHIRHVGTMGTRSTARKIEVDQEIIVIKSVMVIATILLFWMFGSCWETKVQLRKYAEARAAGVKHEGQVSEAFLVRMLALYWRLVKFLVAILALLVMLDRFGPNTGM